MKNLCVVLTIFASVFGWTLMGQAGEVVKASIASTRAVNITEYYISLEKCQFESNGTLSVGSVTELRCHLTVLTDTKVILETNKSLPINDIKNIESVLVHISGLDTNAEIMLVIVGKSKHSVVLELQTHLRDRIDFYGLNY